MEILMSIFIVYFSNLSILATKSGAVEVEGLTDVSIPDLKKANQWYCRGWRARSTSWTNVNDVSSRSHWWVHNLFQSPTFSCCCFSNLNRAQFYVP